MISRMASHIVRQRLQAYPAVALIGPRQSGKTTLAQALGGAYFDLEQPADRLRLNLSWEELAAGQSLVILDEAQAWPEVFPRLRGTIDRARDRMGRFLLLGSVSPALMRQVSESLAGRLSLVELTPFLAVELPDTPLSRLWCCGGYPAGGILTPASFPQWQKDYLSLLVQRDLPLWGLPAKPQITQRLLAMLAAVHGQTWNASQIAAGLGLSYPTVNSYLDYLAGAFLIRRLPPFAANLKKRLVKSSKVYWRDSGLLHAVLNLADETELLNRPWVGASWEGFVIEQILGVLDLQHRSGEAYFLRTSDGQEIDLVLDFGGRRWAIEVKLTSSPEMDDLDRLNKIADLIGADRRFLISQTKECHDDGRQASGNLPWFLKNLPGLVTDNFAN